MVLVQKGYRVLNAVSVPFRTKSGKNKKVKKGDGSASK